MKPRSSLLHALLIGLLILPANGLVADNQTDMDRLNALSEAVEAVGKPVPKPKPVNEPKPATKAKPDAQPEPAAAEVCWTPHGEFSAVGVTSSVPFGPRGLAAKCACGSSDKERNVSAVWRYNNSKEALSVGECKVAPGSLYAANGVLKSEGPLLPGVYEVVFKAGDRIIASGKITVQQPAELGNRKIKEVYLEALNAVDAAVREVDASRAQPAAQAVEKALPLLGTVMKTQPKDDDAVAVYELAQMIIAVAKMESMATKKAADQVLDWGTRAFAHATLAATMAKDPSLKSKAQQYADTLQDALPKIAEAAAGNAK